MYTCEDIDNSMEADNVGMKGEESDTKHDISEREVLVTEIIGSVGTKWREIFRTPSQCAQNFSFNYRTGKGIHSKKTPIEILSLFFTDPILEKIVAYTYMQID